MSLLKRIFGLDRSLMAGNEAVPIRVGYGILAYRLAGRQGQVNKTGRCI